MRAFALLVAAACSGGGGGDRASTSAPLALSADGRSLWVVNPDADSVTRIDVDTLRADAPIPVGREPWSVAVTTAGTVLVLNRADGTLTCLDDDGRTDVAVGAEPGGVAVAGDLAYVTVSSADEVAVVDVSDHHVVRRIAVGRLPWAIGVTEAGSIAVTHRQARAERAWVTLLPEGTEVTLHPVPFGFPNGLEGLAVNGDTAYVAHLLNAPELPRDFEQTVSAGLTTVSLSAKQTVGALHLNDSNFSTPVNSPRAVAVSGDRAYVVLAGTNAVMGIDLARQKLVGFWAVGTNPRGIVLDREGTRAYVMNYLSRDVSVLDLTDSVRRPELARIPVVGETLPAKLLRGKILFNNANDPRISHLGWISCATCHFDGGVDGTTWMTPDGPRQTQPLWNLDGTAPFHASATRDEVQDFEVDIEGLMDGIGLSAGKASDELGTPAEAQSDDLDALAEFVLRGVRVPRAAAAAGGGGRARFIEAGCPTCHGGPQFTRSGLPGAPGTLAPNGEIEVTASLRDVGTRSPLDVLGANGFDVPTLLGLHATAPYLHDGSAATLEDVLRNPAHTQVLLDSSQIADLAAFLRTVDDTTERAP